MHRIRVESAALLAQEMRQRNTTFLKGSTGLLHAVEGQWTGEQDSCLLEELTDRSGNKRAGALDVRSIRAANVSGPAPAHGTSVSLSPGSTRPPGKTAAPGANVIAFTRRIIHVSSPSALSRISATVAAGAGTAPAPGRASRSCEVTRAM